MNVYAVIRSGGKQYRVAPGDVVRVEKLDAGPGETVDLNTVCLLVTGQEVHVGSPVVEGARVRTQVLEEGRGEKILVFKRRRRKGYRKTAGHRQYFTALRISEILFNGAVFRAQEEGPNQAGKRSAEAAAPVRAKKDDDAGRSREKKKRVRGSASAVKEDKGVSEKAGPLRPAEQPGAASELTAAPAPVERAGAESAAVEQKIERTEDKQDAGPSEASAIPSPEEASALPASEEKAAPSPVRSVTPDKTPEQPAASHRRRTAIAMAAALLLLVILLLLWGKSPFTGPRSTRVPVTVQPQPAESVKKTALPVAEKAIEDTTPVDMPSAPAQPPD